MNPHDELPPYAEVLPKGFSKVVVIALALGGASVAAPALARFDTNLADSALGSITLCTGLLSALLLSFTLRIERPFNAALATLFGGGIFGAINAGGTAALAKLVSGGGVSEVLGIFFMGTVFGLAMGSPFGLVYGAFYGVVVAKTVRSRGEPSGDAREPVLTALGGSLAMAGVFASWGNGPIFSVVGTAVGALGVAVLGASVLRDRARVRWLARAGRGEIPGWRLRPAERDDRVSHLVPYLRGCGEGEVVWVIERDATPVDAPFREVERGRAVARVNPHGTLDGSALNARMALAVGAIVLALVGMGLNTQRTSAHPLTPRAGFRI